MSRLQWAIIAVSVLLLLEQFRVLFLRKAHVRSRDMTFFGDGVSVVVYDTIAVFCLLVGLAVWRVAGDRIITVGATSIALTLAIFQSLQLRLVRLVLREQTAELHRGIFAAESFDYRQMARLRSGSQAHLPSGLWVLDADERPLLDIEFYEPREVLIEQLRRRGAALDVQSERRVSPFVRRVLAFLICGSIIGAVAYALVRYNGWPV